MISREDALKLIDSKVTNKNIIKHMIATEAMMGGLWEELKKRGRSDEELGGTKEEWMMAGLLHDGDYVEGVPMEKQGVEITNWARDLGFNIPDNVAHAMASHNKDNTKVEPVSLMDWSIFIGDSLTGLIVACALVLPEKKLKDVTVERVMKKFGSPSFASGTRREDIKLSEEKLGLTLDEFITVTLSAMQNISSEIGL